jgi:hypothetical protein
MTRTDGYNVPDVVAVILVLLAANTAGLIACSALLIVVLRRLNALQHRIHDHAHSLSQRVPLFGDHLSAAKSSFEEIRSTVLYLDTYLWAIRESSASQPQSHRPLTAPSATNATPSMSPPLRQPVTVCLTMSVHWGASSIGRRGAKWTE